MKPRLVLARMDLECFIVGSVRLVFMSMQLLRGGNFSGIRMVVFRVG
jgi:hypothetical protein